MRKAWMFLALGFLVLMPLSRGQDEARSQSSSQRDIPPDTWIIRGAKVLTMAGSTHPEGDILVRAGKIAAVGDNLRLPDRIPVIDATGKTVIPGLIDANSRLLLSTGSKASSRVDGDVLDLFDPFDEDAMEGALAQGVTALALSPPATKGICGRMSVVKLIPGAGPEDCVLERDVALKGGLGIGAPASPLADLKSAKDLGKMFKAAEDYREAWETYEEELKTYLESLEKKKKEEKPKENGTEKAGGKKKEGEGEKKEKDGEEKKEKEKERENKGEAPERLAFQEPDKQPAREKEGDKQEEKKRDELKKPKRPKRELSKELLLKAMDGEMAFQVEAHRAADILAALALKEAYHVDLILVGCTEGYRIPEEIKAAGVPVILGTVARPEMRSTEEYFLHHPGCAAALAEAGIPLAIAGSGRTPGETRFLSLNAALAVGAGLDPQTALEAVTVSAAKILGVDGRIGTIEKGKDADLVILDGHPLESGARVEQVLINGKIVYQAGE